MSAAGRSSASRRPAGSGQRAARGLSLLELDHRGRRLIAPFAITKPIVLSGPPMAVKLLQKLKTRPSKSHFLIEVGISHVARRRIA